MLPPLDRHGLLPPGYHPATLAEVRAAFGFNAHRARLCDGLEAFVRIEHAKLAPKCPLLIDGSFCRKKDEPSDVDIAFEMENTDLADALALAVLLKLQHERIKKRYGVDANVRNTAFGRDIGALFGYLGEKGGADLSLPPKHPKGGILWTP